MLLQSHMHGSRGYVVGSARWSAVLGKVGILSGLVAVFDIFVGLDPRSDGKGNFVVSRNHVVRTEAHLRGVGRGCADTVLEGSNKTSVLETDREFLVEVALALPVPEGLSKELHMAWTRPNYRMYRRRMNQRIPMKASATRNASDRSRVTRWRQLWPHLFASSSQRTVQTCRKSWFKWCLRSRIVATWHDQFQKKRL